MSHPRVRREPATTSSLPSMTAYSPKQINPRLPSPGLICLEGQVPLATKAGPLPQPVFWYPVSLNAPAPPLTASGSFIRSPQPPLITPRYSHPIARPGSLRSPKQPAPPANAGLAGQGGDPAARSFPRMESRMHVSSPAASPIAGDQTELAERQQQEEESCEGSYAAARQPCEFFLRTGTCAYGHRCKFLHPMDRLPELRFNSLNLPLRPGEPVCSFYAKHYRCSFGPTCKFDHPEPPPLAATSGPRMFLPATSPFLVAQVPGTMPMSHDDRGAEHAAPLPPSPFDRDASACLAAFPVPGQIKVATQASASGPLTARESSSAASIWVQTPQQEVGRPIMVFRGSNSSAWGSSLIGSAVLPHSEADAAPAEGEGGDHVGVEAEDD